MGRSGLAVLAFALLAPSSGAALKRAFSFDDLARLRTVSDPRLAPDGQWVAYVVEESDRERDRTTSDIWMVSWDGRRHVRLTADPGADWSPRFSPDGRFIAFLAERGEDQPAQVYLLDRAGGEAVALTSLDGDVEELAWSPDSRRLVLVAADPDPKRLAEKNAPSQGKKKTAPPPIVIERYQFKQDKVGYRDARRTHLYLLDVATRNVERLTSGDQDERLVAWRPDGGRVAFVSKRGGDPDRHWNWDVFSMEPRAGAPAEAVTSFAGADGNPSWESAPVFSPDGRSLAYLRSVDASVEREIYGAPTLAVAAAAGEPRLLTAAVDRGVSDPRFSSDGRHVYFRIEDDRSVQLARVPVAGGDVQRLTERGRVVLGYDLGAEGRIALVTGRGDEPAELQALEAGKLRPLSRQNADLLEDVALLPSEELDVRSADGTPIGAMLTKPAGFQAGTRYPAVLYIHGGPTAQDQHELDPWTQAFAGQGYLVVQPNYRGSSGRGFDFSRAIFADWGKREVQDVLAAVDAVVAQGLADPTRLAIGGWSYGGMLTHYTIASDTRFKAAASGASISNMLTGYGTDQYIQQYENELGLPWKGIEAYLRTSYPFFHADRISTPTLFLCGDQDFNVPLLNSEQMYQALRSLGVKTRLVIYPGEHHGLRAPSHKRDVLERYTGWFDELLGRR